MRVFLSVSLMLFSFAAFAQGPSRSVFTAPHFSGVYDLQQGTDDCPEQLRWRERPACGGFQLNETHRGQVLPGAYQELFCHINKGSFTEMQRQRGSESLRVRYNVRADDRLAQKEQQIEHRLNGVPYNVELQASVILDDGRQFLLDRSLGGKGWSCLYRKMN